MGQLYPVDSGLKVPILIAHGTADTTVDPDVIKQLVDKLCKNGETVRLLLLPGVGHLKTGHDAAPDVLKRINDRFAGKPRVGCQNYVHAAGQFDLQAETGLGRSRSRSGYGCPRGRITPKY